MGWKSGVGGVIKIMADAAYPPLTTPNTDWWKFRFNSETAAIGYGDKDYQQTINYRDLSYPEFPGRDYYFPTGSAATGKVHVYTNGASFYDATTYFMGNNIWPNRNTFPYIFENTTAFRYKYTMFQRNYPGGSSDSRTISMEGYPTDRIIPYSSNGVFSIRGLGQLDSNDVKAEGQIVRFAGRVSTDNPSNYNFACYHLDMPVNNSAYPAVAPGTPVSGQKMVRIDPATARMSKPGFSVDTATDVQCIFSSNKLPMKIIKTGAVTVNAGATVNVAMGRTLAQSTWVDYQVKSLTSGDMWIPPWPDVNSKAICHVAYRFNSTNLQFQNTGSVNVEVRYVVMAQDDLDGSTGTAKVFDGNATTGRIVLRRPNSAGTRFADTILDSDLAYMPMVAQAWVPIGSFVASDTSQIGGLMHRVALTNGGSWKPYVVARLACRKKTDASQVLYMAPYAKKLDNTANFAASNFMIRVTDTQVTFYASTDNARDEDAYRIGVGAWQTEKWDWVPIGLRYYVFALPTSL